MKNKIVRVTICFMALILFNSSNYTTQGYAFTFTKEIQTLDAPDNVLLGARLSPLGNFSSGYLSEIERFPDGAVDYNEGAQYFWDLETFGMTEISLVDTSSGTRFAFSPNDRYIAFASNNAIEIRSIPDLKTVMTIPLYETLPDNVLEITTERPPFVDWAWNRDILIAVNDNQILIITPDTQSVHSHSIAYHFNTYPFIKKSRMEWVIYPESFLNSEDDFFITCHQLTLKCETYFIDDLNHAGAISYDGNIMLTSHYVETENKQVVNVWGKEGGTFFLHQQALAISAEHSIMAFNTSSQFLLTTRERRQWTVWNYETLEPVLTLEALDVEWIPFTDYLIVLKLDISLDIGKIILELYSTNSQVPVSILHLAEFKGEEDMERLYFYKDFFDIESVTRDATSALVNLGFSSYVIYIKKG